MTTMLMLDAIRASTQADLALNPGDEGFFDAFRRKEITRYDVYAAMPFKNRVAAADLTGAEIQELQKAHPDTVVSGDASPLDAAKTYRVAFVDFIALSLYRLPAARLRDTGRDLREVVIAYLGQQKRAMTAPPARPVSRRQVRPAAGTGG